MAENATSGATYNINVSGAFDRERTAREIVDTQSMILSIAAQVAQLTCKLHEQSINPIWRVTIGGVAVSPPPFWPI
jgi:hypothetical protein